MTDLETTPRISVLVPVYNAGPYLQEMLASLQRQTYTDYEVVLVDDGSTDGSAEILDEAARADQRLRILRLPKNQGIVGALNHGLQACRGEFVARMDADDIALPDRLMQQVAHLEAHPDVAALSTGLAYIDAAGRSLARVRRPLPVDHLLRANPLLHPTVMLRRQILDAGGLRYRPEFALAEDYYLWMELSRHGRLASLDEVMVLYRLSPTALRSSRLKGMLRATLRAKWCGVVRLGLRPRLPDVFAFATEAVLLALPSALVWRLYLRLTFGSWRPRS
jgi:glycosyltransferase involved in cell wall biosynthesis